MFAGALVTALTGRAFDLATLDIAEGALLALGCRDFTGFLMTPILGGGHRRGRRRRGGFGRRRAIVLLRARGAGEGEGQKEEECGPVKPAKV